MTKAETNDILFDRMLSMMLSVSSARPQLLNERFLEEIGQLDFHRTRDLSNSLLEEILLVWLEDLRRYFIHTPGAIIVPLRRDLSPSKEYSNIGNDLGHLVDVNAALHILHGACISLLSVLPGGLELPHNLVLLSSGIHPISTPFAGRKQEQLLVLQLSRLSG